MSALTDEHVALEPDVLLALDLAYRADEMSSAFRGQALHARAKADGSPVTDVDLAVERELLSRLARERPSDRVLSEEAGPSGPAESARRWLIDPIDGTRSLVEGTTSWGTHIALEVSGVVVVGVVTRPALGHQLWARRGGGAFRRGGPGAPEEPIRLPGDVSGRPRVTGFVDEPSPGSRALREAGLWVEHVADPISALFDGQADALLDEGGNVWDIAPLCVLVPEAGGVFHDPTGGMSPEMRWALAAGRGAIDTVSQMLRPPGRR